MMTKRLFRLSTSAGLMIVLVAAALFWAQGSAAAGKERCSLGTLRGTYVYSARGVLLDGQTALPYAEAGNWTFDGAGHAEGIFSASLNGETFANREAFTATYRHEGNCVFTALAPVGDATLEFHLYPTEKAETMTYYSAGISGTQFKR